MERAFTLLEALISMFIVVIVVAITFPAIQSANLSAKQTYVKGQLKQLHLAVTLYRTDHDGIGKYGQGAEMGLPPTALIGRDDNRRVALRQYGATDSLWASGCGNHPQSGGSTGSNFPLWNDRSIDMGRPTPWELDVVVFKENAALIVNVHCNWPSIDILNQLESKTGIAVKLNGTIVQRYRKGNPFRSQFYGDPEL